MGGVLDRLRLHGEDFGVRHATSRSSLRPPRARGPRRGALAGRASPRRAAQASRRRSSRTPSPPRAGSARGGRVLHLRRADDAERRLHAAASCAAYQLGLVGGADQAGAPGVDRLEPAEAAREPAGDAAPRARRRPPRPGRSSRRTRCSSTARDGVEVGRRVERLREDLDRDDPVDPQHAGARRWRATSTAGTTGRGGSRRPTGRRPARGRDPAPSGSQAQPAAGAAGLDDRGPWSPGRGWRPARRGARRPTRRTALGGPRRPAPGRARMILPSALPTGSVGSPAAWSPSSTAITRPSASAVVNIRGGSRCPRPTR